MSWSYAPLSPHLFNRLHQQANSFFHPYYHPPIQLSSISLPCSPHPPPLPFCRSALSSPPQSHPTQLVPSPPRSFETSSRASPKANGTSTDHFLRNLSTTDKSTHPYDLPITSTHIAVSDETISITSIPSSIRDSRSSSCSNLLSYSNTSLSNFLENSTTSYLSTQSSPRDFSPSMASASSTRIEMGGKPSASHDLSESTCEETGSSTMSSKLPAASPASAAPSAMKRNFIVLSFNTLSQCYLMRHQRELYSRHSPEALQWERRRDLIIGEILEKTPDIVCLQEVDDVHFQDFYSPVLEKFGFSGRFNPRRLDGSKPDGVAIFYRTSAFNLLECHPVDLNKRTGILTRDNVALILVLEPICVVDQVENKGFPYPSFDPVAVATTHLLFSPKRGDIKLAQLGVIFAELDWITRERNQPPSLDSSSSPPPPRQMPVIVCGDMNFEPFCPIFDFVVDGSVKYGGVDYKSLNGAIENHRMPPKKSGRSGSIANESTLFPPSIGITERCRKSTSASSDSDSDAASDPTRAGSSNGYLYHSLNLKSAYHMDYRTKRRTNSNGIKEDGSNAPEHRRDYEFMTTNHDRASCAVDFIFFNETPKFQLLGTSPIPKIDSVSKIPNEIYGSDHFSIAASFSMRAEEKFYEF